MRDRKRKTPQAGFVLLLRRKRDYLHDPVGEILQQQNKPVGFFFSGKSLCKQAFNGPAGKEKPRLRGLFYCCGERGIRTPGPPISGQRFSRPPHSTTLPFLRCKNNQNFKIPASLGVVPPLPIILCQSSFVNHPSSIILHQSSFILHPSSFPSPPSLSRNRSKFQKKIRVVEKFPEQQRIKHNHLYIKHLHSQTCIIMCE